MRLQHAAAAVVVAAILFSGCSKSPPPIVEARGMVLLDGEPVRKVQVRFIPNIDFGPEYVALGVTDDKGRFELRCNGQQGACACANTVTVSEADIPPKLLLEDAQLELQKYLRELGQRPIPRQYENAADSPLRINVTTDEGVYILKLTR